MDAIRIGILYSTVGPYGAIGRDCHDGARLAIEALIEEAQLPYRLEPVFEDPAGQPERYLEQARAMLRERGCRHIVGTITSLARKDVLPLVEKHDGQLWYVCPYEGFEANENVIYTGACPNQHLLPLFDYLLPLFGARAYLLGANYVWGWEMNRLARELLARAGGEVIAERCLPLEETEVERLIADVAARRPDFVLNNLIGPASYSFLRSFKQLGERDRAFRPEHCPVVSCDLTECELDEIGPGIAAGNLAAAVYFDSLTTPENLAFKARVAKRFGLKRRVSSFFAGAYAAVRLCAEAIARAGSDEPSAVRQAVSSRPQDTVLGRLVIDERNNHASLPFHLGRIAPDNSFDIIASRPAIPADPYLAGEPAARGAPKLRVVS